MKPIINLLFLALIILSCTNNSKYRYAIRDFSNELKPYLEKIVSRGIAGYDLSVIYLRDHAADSELSRISRSEHPVLRMVTLRIMQQRDSLNLFGFLMSHLDDSAIVAIDEGEFGINFRRIPDVLLKILLWKTVENKNKIIEKVLLKHNYLYYAYKVLDYLEPEEKYYQSIKEMAQRDRPYEEIDFAVYGLAKFKKQEDIKLIVSILYENKWQLEGHSFLLMEKYPHDDYLNILSFYAKEHFARNIISGRQAVPSEEFFNALASYKRKETAELLPVLLNRISRVGCYTDTNYLKMSLYQAFLKNKCEAYSSILPQIELDLEKVIKEMQAKQRRYNEIR